MLMIKKHLAEVNWIDRVSRLTEPNLLEKYSLIFFCIYLLD